jgi:hypothetical protein
MLTRQFAKALPDGTDGLVVNMIDQQVWKPTPRYFLYAVQVRALGRNQNDGAGVGAKYPGERSGRDRRCATTSRRMRNSRR